MMAVIEQQAAALFEKIRTSEAHLFYIKTSAEYGELGTRAMTPTQPFVEREHSPLMAQSAKRWSACEFGDFSRSSESTYALG